MTTLTPDRGPILPCLQPPRWADASQVLCEPLVGDTPRWNAEIDLPWVGYGIETPDTFEFFGADPGRLVEMRAIARATLTALAFELDRLDYERFSVLDVHGSYFASESLLDPAFMRSLQQRLDTDMLAVGIPCRGHAYVTAGTQSEDALRRFVDLIAQQHGSARAPLFEYPVLVQHGDPVGLLRLADEDEDEDLETLELVQDA